MVQPDLGRRPWMPPGFQSWAGSRPTWSASLRNILKPHGGQVASPGPVKVTVPSQSRQGFSTNKCSGMTRTVLRPR